MAEAELGGSTLPSMGRREKGLETDDEHFLFPWSGKQKEGERPIQGIIKAVYIPFSVVNNGNCIYLRAQLFFCATKFNSHFHASY